MRPLLIAGAALAAGLVSFLTPASAYYVRGPEAPWCAVVNIGMGNVRWDCSYATFEACWPNVIAGNRGFCNHNPYYGGPAVVEHRRHWRRHARRY
jgi:Protein of unknown function (DUF3551)